MERLDFVLPDFTRLSWVSDAAREVWELRLKRIAKAWLEIEWLTVASGIRRCGVTMASPEDFVARAGEWAKHGLNALPLQIQGLSNYSYSSTGVKAEMGKPFVFRFVLGTPEDVSDFKCAWDTSDDREIGRLLGYPSCCYEFFRHVWVEQGLVDTTWPMAVASVGPSERGTTVEVGGPPQVNILWRWMGARAVSHLPCRFDCQPSMELADEFLEVGRKAGYGTEVDWLLEVLSWPVEWSALHGIAEIKTPVLKVSTRTDATPREYVVRRNGAEYPLEGAQGLNFPYRGPHSLYITHSRGFQRGLDSTIQVLSRYPEWYASDNGFHSTGAMENAHKPVVELTVTALSGRGGNVLDLGCGNGALVTRIQKANPDIVPFGIELESSRVEHARLLSPDFAENFTLGDMFESELIWSEARRYALAILMLGRLLEAGPERAAKLKNRLAGQCDQVLVYAYGDWLIRYGNLQGLAKQVAVVLLNSAADAMASLANVYSWEAEPEQSRRRRYECR